MVQMMTNDANGKIVRKSWRSVVPHQTATESEAEADSAAAAVRSPLVADHTIASFGAAEGHHRTSLMHNREEIQ
jgi:hypothetical protein